MNLDLLQFQIPNDFFELFPFFSGRANRLWPYTLQFDGVNGHFVGDDVVGVTVDISSTSKQTVVDSLIDLTIQSTTALENVLGTPIADTITGNTPPTTTFSTPAAHVDHLMGDKGDDILDGRNINASNILEGSEGNDTLISGFGDVLVKDEGGNDTYKSLKTSNNGHDAIDEVGGCQDQGVLELRRHAHSVLLDFGSTEKQTLTNLELTITNSNAVERILVPRLNGAQDF